MDGLGVMSMPGERLRRVGELLRAEISEVLLREVRDPGLHGLLTITGVKVSADLAHAQVFVSVMGEDEEIASSFDALSRAEPFIRALLKSRLDLRRVPVLDFKLDDTAVRAQRIEKLIRVLREEAGKQGEGDEEEQAKEPVGEHGGDGDEGEEGDGDTGEGRDAEAPGGAGAGGSDER